MIRIQPVIQVYHLVSKRPFLVSRVLNGVLNVLGWTGRKSAGGAEGSEPGTGGPRPRKERSIEARGRGGFAELLLISGAGSLVSQNFTVTRLQISWEFGLCCSL